MSERSVCLTVLYLLYNVPPVNMSVYRSTLQLKVASISIITLMLQPASPLGTSHFVARSTKLIHMGSKGEIFSSKLE